jgi:hypothetical protein
MDDTSRGWGLSLGHQRGPHMATSGDFVTAVDKTPGARLPQRPALAGEATAHNVGAGNGVET